MTRIVRGDPAAPRHAQEVGPPPREIDGGRVAQTGRWFSYDWWHGHWMERNAEGEFRREGSGAYGTRPRGPRGRRHADYRAYLEAQHDSAEQATRGNLLNARGRRAEISPRSAWFSGRSGSDRYASDELREWMRSHRVLTFREFEQQGAEPARRVRIRRGRAA